jgi:hypothetical protein
MRRLRNAVRLVGARTRRAGIPYSDGVALAAPARRTTWWRAVLGVSLAALLVVEVALARRQAPTPEGFVPEGTSGVVVIDLSESVFKGFFPEIRGALSKIAAADDPAGLVLFSDTAYELLPPGAPGSELRRMMRFFTPLNRPRNQWEARFPQNPWQATFRGGTKISAGLDLALDALERDRITNGSVLLISDLDYHAFDVPRLTQALVDFRTRKIPLRIAALDPQPDDRAFFAQFAGDDAFVKQTRLRGSGRSDDGQIVRGDIGWFMVLAGALLVALLAANEHWCARLTLPRGPRSGGL